MEYRENTQRTNYMTLIGCVCVHVHARVRVCVCTVCVCVTI